MKNNKFNLYFWGSIGIILLIGFLSWLFYFRFHKFTRDSYVMGNQIVLTPLHDGFVTAIYSDDTFLVKKGDLLIQLDESDAKLAFDKAKEQLANTTREISQMYHQLFAWRAEIQVREAEYIKASQDMQHRDDVIDQGGVSIENYEHAQAALKASYFLLQMTKSFYEKEKAFLQGVSIRNHPLIVKAIDEFRDAWLYLYRCKIYAPNDGIVAQRTIQVGMHVKQGEPLLAIIPLDQIWVNANYKETQMAKMRIGQKVLLKSDFYGPSVFFHGTIVGLPGGAGNAFSILPPQNLSGNWIKIVQRLPVRIALDSNELQQHPLRIGLTMTANTDISNTSGLMVPINTIGSPNYITSVFEKEENGSLEFANDVFYQNLDPLLISYADNPLMIEEEFSDEG
jgi:membrane fusion protein (multidrug efflux system)